MNTKLSYSQIQSIAERLNSSSSNMEALLNEIKSLFDKIGSEEVWSGTAASETKNSFNELSQKFPEFSASVSDCYTYLNNVIENYKSVDNIISGQ